MKDVLQAIVFSGLFLVPIFLPIYVENDLFFPYITGKNFAFRIIVEIILGAWILLALFDAEYRPKFSWILAAFVSLLGVMVFANALGEYPLKSFWSNFERMDGYVTLLHVFAFLLVAGSVLTTKKRWSFFFMASVVVAFGVALYGLAQHSGIIEGGRARVDSRLGNAAYMAVYMLFHIFIVFWLLVQTTRKETLLRAAYGLALITFIYALLLTGTRGTFLGFVGGSVAAVTYLALFGSAYPQLRKFAVGGFVTIIILSAGFFAVRDMPFIQQAGPVARIANIDLGKDLVVRSTIWHLAWQGVEERPLLGWGQGNFNYVFNQNFDPALWGQESWFDRVHNIFLDWLIAGGWLGLIAYLSIFVAALYYLFWLPLSQPTKEESFTVLERAVLLGLLVGYFMHNLVVFDNIISYIFFGAILALIHSRVATPLRWIETIRLDNRVVMQFALPVMLVMTGVTIYFVNMPGILAAGDIIDGIQAPTVIARLEAFDSAINRHSFADQEIVEQLAQNAMQIARNQNLPPEERQAFVQRAELELLRLTTDKPGDARLHTFFATFYRTIGALDQAREQAALARMYSPQKQAIIIEQGIVEFQAADYEAARDFFAEALQLDESFTQARILYASLLIRTNDIAAATELIGEEYMDAFAANDFALSILSEASEPEFLIKVFESRVRQKPNNPQNWASLSFLYFQEGKTNEAISALQSAADVSPEFAPRAACFITNIKAGNEPEKGC